MMEPKQKPTVKLIGLDSNAFAILGRVQDALRKAGADDEYIAQYQREATSGDYSNLLFVTSSPVTVIINSPSLKWRRVIFLYDFGEKIDSLSETILMAHLKNLLKKRK